MIKKLKLLGYREYPKFSEENWTCYKHVKGWLWCFVDKTNSVIKAEVDDNITLTIEEVRAITKLIHG